MEALTERADPAGTLLPANRPWAAEERRTERVAPLDESQDLPAERGAWFNRAINVLLAVVALVVASPVLVLVALLVKLTSRGPVFYTLPHRQLSLRHHLQ